MPSIPDPPYHFPQDVLDLQLPGLAEMLASDIAQTPSLVINLPPSASQREGNDTDMPKHPGKTMTAMYHPYQTTPEEFVDHSLTTAEIFIPPGRRLPGTIAIHMPTDEIPIPKSCAKTPNTTGLSSGLGSGSHQSANLISTPARYTSGENIQDAFSERHDVDRDYPKHFLIPAPHNPGGESKAEDVQRQAPVAATNNGRARTAEGATVDPALVIAGNGAHIATNMDPNLVNNKEQILIQNPSSVLLPGEIFVRIITGPIRLGFQNNRTPLRQGHQASMIIRRADIRVAAHSFTLRWEESNLAMLGQQEFSHLITTADIFTVSDNDTELQIILVNVGEVSHNKRKVRWHIEFSKHLDKAQNHKDACHVRDLLNVLKQTGVRAVRGTPGSTEPAGTSHPAVAGPAAHVTSQSAESPLDRKSIPVSGPPATVSASASGASRPDAVNRSVSVAAKPQLSTVNPSTAALQSHSLYLQGTSDAYSHLFQRQQQAQAAAIRMKSKLATTMGPPARKPSVAGTLNTSTSQQGAANGQLNQVPTAYVGAAMPPNLDTGLFANSSLPPVAATSAQAQSAGLSGLQHPAGFSGLQAPAAGFSGVQPLSSGVSSDKLGLIDPKLTEPKHRTPLQESILDIARSYSAQPEHAIHPKPAEASGSKTAETVQAPKRRSGRPRRNPRPEDATLAEAGPSQPAEPTKSGSSVAGENSHIVKMNVGSKKHPDAAETKTTEAGASDAGTREAGGAKWKGKSPAQPSFPQMTGVDLGASPDLIFPGKTRSQRAAYAALLKQEQEAANAEEANVGGGTSTQAGRKRKVNKATDAQGGSSNVSAGQEGIQEGHSANGVQKPMKKVRVKIVSNAEAQENERHKDT